MICHVKPEKLLKVRRKRKPITAMDITELLKDPMFRAMIEFRKALRAAAKRHRKEYEEFGEPLD